MCSLCFIGYQENYICSNKCSDKKKLMSKGFTEESLIFFSKTFIDYLFDKEDEYRVNRIQHSVFRFLYILVNIALHISTSQIRTRSYQPLIRDMLVLKKLKLNRKID